MSMDGRRELELEAARREELRLEQVRGECMALIELCEAQLAAVRDAAVQQLAGRELRESVAALRDLRRRVRDQPDAVREPLHDVVISMQQAIALAEGRARAWTDAQAAAVAQARQAQVEAAAIHTASSSTGDAVRLAAEAVAAAERGDVGTAESLTAATRHSAAGASAGALDERIRREVVRGILATLKEMGFVVAGPRLDADVVVLEGRLASGRRARFEVKLDGELAFDLDGYEGRSCADDLLKVETTLRDRFGVKLGPPQVVWKNPDRLSQGARDLPDGGQTRRR